MSATLTWASSGNGTKTGTTNTTCLDDLDTLITSKAGDATFFWEKAGKSNSGTPRYLLLRRKDGSAGRIAIIIWDSAPANNNAAILDGAPASNALQVAWFPAGTGTTLSNLTAASGTICGTDTGVVKCCSPGSISSLYSANYVPFYFDSAEAMVILFADPSTTNMYGFAIGDVLVDASDVAYGGIICPTGGSWNSLGSSGGSFCSWTVTQTLAGTGSNHVRTNYGAAGRTYYRGLAPSGSWANAAVGPNDLLSDTTLNKAWFASVQLLGTTRGEGFVLKMRQIGYGPGAVGAFQVYNTTGPVVSARQMSNSTAGGNGFSWVTNFKI